MPYVCCVCVGGSASASYVLFVGGRECECLMCVVCVWEGVRVPYVCVCVCVCVRECECLLCVVCVWEGV